jgi:hypothetical protein
MNLRAPELLILLTVVPYGVTIWGIVDSASRRAPTSSPARPPPTHGVTDHDWSAPQPRNHARDPHEIDEPAGSDFSRTIGANAGAPSTA